MRITMAMVEDTLEDEIAQGATQKQVAATYAWALRNFQQGEIVDFTRINRAILARWPKGLERVKRLAQKWYLDQFKHDWFTGEAVP